MHIALRPVAEGERALRFETALAAVEEALRWVDRAWYRWGGQDPRGFDCSGLVVWSFAVAGVQLPRRSLDLWRIGSRLDDTRGWRPGDIAFFSTTRRNGNNPDHVALLLTRSHVLVAPGWGRPVGVQQLSGQLLQSLAGVRRITEALPLAPPVGNPQALLTPQPSDQLAVEQVAFPAQYHTRPLVPPPWVSASEPAQTLPQRCVPASSLGSLRRL